MLEKVSKRILVGIAAATFVLGYGVGSWREERVLMAASKPNVVERILGIGQLPDAQTVSKDVEFRQFWDAWQTLKDKYYEQPVQDSTLFYGALTGMTASLNDPYTSYFPPEQAQEFKQALAGKFEGIGAEIGLKDDALTIIAPLPDSPAEHAGILAGDIIVNIDKQDATAMTVDKAVTLIRGPKGTKVMLTLLRPSQLKKPPFELTITRDEIRIKSVSWKMLDHNVALITVTHFNGDTKDGFAQAVSEALAKNPKGVVLDLRNNPGGFLETALSLVGEWVSDGVVVQERRQGKIVDELHGTGQGRLRGLPAVALVNQGSASASEIVAGALQDLHQATIVGMKTFGKGVVQDQQLFPDGSSIKFTVSEWLTPEGRTINKTGLMPDVIVDRTQDDYEKQRDPQLDRAVGILAGTATGTAVGVPQTASSSR